MSVITNEVNSVTQDHHVNSKVSSNPDTSTSNQLPPDKLRNVSMKNAGDTIPGAGVEETDSKTDSQKATVAGNITDVNETDPPNALVKAEKAALEEGEDMARMENEEEDDDEFLTTNEYGEDGPEGFTLSSAEVDNLANSAIRKSNKGKADLHKLVKKMAEDMHDSHLKYKELKENWKNILFIIRRRCPDDDNKTYRKWIDAIKTYFAAKGNERMVSFIENMFTRATQAFTPFVNIPSSLREGIRLLLLSLFWLSAREGQWMNLALVPYSTLDLIERYTKQCMNAAEAKEAIASAAGTKSSGVESALGPELSGRPIRRPSQKCPSGMYKGKIRQWDSTDAELFKEIWGTRRKEINDWMDVKESELEKKKADLVEMKSYADDNSRSIKELEDGVSKLDKELEWADDYLNIGGKIAKRGWWANLVHDTQKKLGIKGRALARFWLEIAMAKDDRTRAARKDILDTTTKIGKTFGSEKVKTAVAVAEEVSNVTGGLSALVETGEEKQKLKGKIAELDDTIGQEDISTGDRQKAMDEKDGLEKKLRVERVKHLAALDATIVTATKLAERTPDSLATKEQRTELSQQALELTQTLKDISKMTASAEKTQQLQATQEAIMKQLDDRNIYTDKAKRDKLEAKLDSVETQLSAHAALQSSDLEKLMDKGKLCEEGEADDCQKGQLCVKEKDKIYTEAECEELMNVKSDKRNCSWTGYKCAVKGSDILSEIKKKHLDVTDKMKDVADAEQRAIDAEGSPRRSRRKAREVRRKLYGSRRRS